MSSPAGRPGPRVTMLVRNPFTHDSRVEKEARTLTEAGYQVVVVADGAAHLPAAEDRDGYAVRRVARTLPAVPLLRFFAQDRRLEDALAKTRPQVLHAHDSNALVPVARVAGRLGVPFVYDGHDLWTGRAPHGRSPLYRMAANVFYRWAERRYLPRAARRITVSAPLARHLERAYHLPPFTLVWNYPLLAEVRGEKVRDLRSLPGGDAIPEDARIVLHVGGLMEERGLEVLVDAMSQTGATVHLVLLGEGVLAPALREQAARTGVAGRVHILGPVPSGEVVDYAASADVGVAPVTPSYLNHRYSLPNKLFQYMAARLPVLATDLPQFREVLEANGAGECVDTQDPAALARGIERVLADRPTARQMGERGRRAVEERFNWATAAGELLDLYAGILPATRSVSLEPPPGPGA